MLLIVSTTVGHAGVEPIRAIEREPLMSIRVWGSPHLYRWGGFTDEHDSFSDIVSISAGDVKDRSAYIQGKTVIKNRYASTYTFWCFPDSHSDPFGYHTGAYEAVNGGGKTTDVPFKVRVSTDDLQVRSDPGTDCPVTARCIGKGTFTIVEVTPGKGSEAGRGRLKSGAGWISLDHAIRIRVL